MVSAEQAYSFLGVVGDLLLTKDGSVCIAYLLENPEPYSMDADLMESRLESFHLALKDMPVDSYYHRQDVFVESAYDPRIHDYPNTFISTAEKEHFQGRKYLKHYCVLAFTLCSLESLEKAYNANPMRYSEGMAKQDMERLENFLDIVGGAISIIKNIPFTKVKRLETDELKYYLFQFVNGFKEDNGIRDIRFEGKFMQGTEKGSVFAISDENYLPDTFDSIIYDKTLNVENPNVKLHMARLEQLGIHLECNHIINQIIYFPGNQFLRQQLESRIIQHGQYRNFGGDIALKHGKLKKYQEDILENDAVLCRIHYNVIVWHEDDAALKSAEDKVKEVFRNQGFKYYVPSFEGLFNIYIGSIVGRERKLDRRYFFTADLYAGLSFAINYGPYKDDPAGVLFTDRIFSIPRRVDLWNGGAVKLPARNGMFVASTGGGKSATSLHILQQYIEQGVKTIIVEFGSSFKALSLMYPGRSAHIAYQTDTNLGINPFHIESAEELTTDKLNTLTMIVLKYWRKKSTDLNADITIALTKIIRDYFANVSGEYSFPSFYNFVKERYNEIIHRLNLDPSYFDVKSFLHVCSEFMPGGLYANVCAPEGDTVDRIRNNDFIVFELSEVKKDPFLVSIIMSAIFDAVENKILSDRSTKGMLIFDEYAETQTLRDYFSGDDIHSTVAFAYQKLRKENGQINTIIQSPSQLPDNEYTKSIIANTQLLYVLPTTETVYDQVIEAFHMKSKAQIDLMRSIKSEFKIQRPYNEVFIRFLDSYAVVHKLEFSREKFYAFQTDGETWQAIQNLYKELGNMPKAIRQYMLDKHEKVNDFDYSDATSGFKR